MKIQELQAQRKWLPAEAVIPIFIWKCIHKFSENFPLFSVDAGRKIRYNNVYASPTYP